MLSMSSIVIDTIINMAPPSSDAGPKRRLGRPREFDQEAALSLALELFWQHGFEGTSTASLAAAMGISPPSLYAAFGSKENLYRLAVDRYLAEFGGFLAQPLAARTPAKDAIAEVLTRAARQFTETGHAPGCMVSCAELQASPTGSSAVLQMKGLRAQAQQAIRARLDDARQAGELPESTSTKDLAAYFAMVIQGMAVQARDGANEPSLASMARLAMKAWPDRVDAASGPTSV